MTPDPLDRRLLALLQAAARASTAALARRLGVARTTVLARLDALLDEIGAIEGVRKTTTSVLLARRIDRTSS